MSIIVTLTDQDKATLRTAAYGAVSLMAAADVTGKPHRASTRGALALTSVTGPVGHVLAAKSRDITLTGKSVAELADHVLPALTAAMDTLARQDRVEADNFRSAVLVAVEATRTRRDDPSPVRDEMARKITAALDASTGLS
ncbi:hypothetical protein AB0L57_14025 [Nocardia sp. NPDC052254]|uniref:hypothetical protein n=1 Tax=Nocardia sp. NPDC052254 TaxID=3155681 RepID=UPI003445D163